MYIVYTEIIPSNYSEPVQRWYYGTYSEARADEVAYQLGSNRAEGIYHCVCKVEEAETLGIRNLYNRG